jgi:hypothetical protein
VFAWDPALAVAPDICAAEASVAPDYPVKNGVIVRLAAEATRAIEELSLVVSAFRRTIRN